MPTALDRPTRTVTSTRNRSSVRVPYRYGILTEDLLRVDVTVRVGRSRAVGVLRYVPKLDYPLMYLKDIR